MPSCFMSIAIKSSQELNEGQAFPITDFYLSESDTKG